MTCSCGIARGELQRRSGQLRITGPELDDLAYQATADALLAIVAKLDQFRGESKFTTWAYKFVIFEVAAKIGRHFWSNQTVPMDAEDWERLPGRGRPRAAGRAAGSGRLVVLKDASGARGSRPVTSRTPPAPPRRPVPRPAAGSASPAIRHPLP